MACDADANGYGYVGEKGCGGPMHIVTSRWKKNKRNKCTRGRTCEA